MIFFPSGLTELPPIAKDYLTKKPNMAGMRSLLPSCWSGLSKRIPTTIGYFCYP